MSMPAFQPEAIVVDIEGTTTPVTFVTEVLFPFARKRLPEFVARHGDEPEVREILASAASLMEDAAPSTWRLVETMQRWIDEDLKLTPLKSLQGLIWKDGYQSGQLQAPLYDDVAPCLARWRECGIRLYVYSSGSEEAQKLLFQHSSAGDIRELFEGYFDTRIGAKVDSLSYTAIASELGARPSTILFLTDSPKEVTAARGAGWRVVRLDRESVPTGAVHDEHGELVAATFNEVAAWLQAPSH